MSSVGGNKKSSSQSDMNYWSRAKASNYAQTHKDKRIARHARRMGLSKSQVGAACVPPTFPKRHEEAPKTFVTFMSSTVPEYRTFDEHGNITSYPTFVIKEGVTTDVLRVKKPAVK